MSCREQGTAKQGKRSLAIFGLICIKRTAMHSSHLISLIMITYPAWFVKRLFIISSIQAVFFFS